MITDPNASAMLADDGEHIEFRHQCMSDKTVVGLLPINPQTGWAVICKDPLTVTPSVLCKTCGWHGWIQNGECVK